MDAYKVIDGDKNIVRQLFSKDQTEQVLKYWEDSGEYDNISVDIDGDIICFKEQDYYEEYEL